MDLNKGWLLKSYRPRRVTEALIDCEADLICIQEPGVWARPLRRWAEPMCLSSSLEPVQPHCTDLSYRTVTVDLGGNVISNRR